MRRMALLAGLPVCLMHAWSNFALVVLVFGCAYWRIADKSCSETTLRRRRVEWIALGVMDTLRELVLEVHDRIIGLELAMAAVDGCITKAPCGGEKAEWCEERNRLGACVYWRFTTQDARIKLRSLYPSMQG